MRKYVRHIGFVLIFSAVVAAQSVYREAPPSLLEIRWANDIAYQTDYYFTNGVQVAWHRGRLPSRLLSAFHLGYSSGDVVITSFSLRHDIFTPKNVNAATIQYNDRPYASYLLFENQQTVIDPIRRLKKSSSLQISLLGKMSGGEGVQNGIHELLPASRPVAGWRFQLSTDAAINYGLALEKNLLWSKHFRINGSAAGRVGLPYTDAALNLSWELGKMPSYYGYPFVRNRRGWFFYLQSVFGVEYRLYDATIQGGWLQSHNIHTLEAITPLRYSFGNALIIGRNGFQVELGHRWKSSEFEGAKAHGYGYISFQFEL